MKDLRDFPGWQERIRDLFAEGRLETEVRASMRMTKTEWRFFFQSSDEFAREVELGLDVCESEWASAPAKGRLPNGEKFNQNAWALIMKNAFGWSDRQTVSVDARNERSASGLTDDAIEKRLAQLEKESPLRTH